MSNTVENSDPFYQNFIVCLKSNTLRKTVCFFFVKYFNLLQYNLIKLNTEFSINGLSTVNHNGPPTPSKIKVNNSKSKDLMINIEVTRAILMPRFSNFLRNLTIQIFACFHIW